MAPAHPKLADRRWLEQRYLADGATVEAIAEEAGAERSTVYRALWYHAIDRRGHLNVEAWSSRLTPDVLAPMLEAGKRPSEIAWELGCSPQTLLNALARHQLLPTDPREDQQLRQWYEAEGLSVEQIAVRLRRGPQATRRRLRAAGVQMRPAGRPAGPGRQRPTHGTEGDE